MILKGIGIDKAFAYKEVLNSELHKLETKAGNLEIYGIELRNCHDLFTITMNINRLMESWAQDREDDMLEHLNSGEEIDREKLATEVVTIELALNREEGLMFQIAEELAGLEAQGLDEDTQDEVNIMII